MLTYLILGGHCFNDIHLHVYIYICICKYIMYTYIHTSMHACIHIYIYIHTYMHACMHTYIHACMHTYIHTFWLSAHSDSSRPCSKFCLTGHHQRSPVLSRRHIPVPSSTSIGRKIHWGSVHQHPWENPSVNAKNWTVRRHKKQGGTLWAPLC